MSDESDRDLAVKTLREICSDFDAPKQAKATAARTLLELVGEIGKLQSEKPRDSRALHELTREELDAEIARASKVRPNGARVQVQNKPGRRPKARRRIAKPTKSERLKYDF